MRNTPKVFFLWSNVFSEKLHKNNTEQSPSGSVEEADKTSELSHIVNSEKSRESNGIWMGFGTDLKQHMWSSIIYKAVMEE